MTMNKKRRDFLASAGAMTLAALAPRRAWSADRVRRP